MKSIKRKNTKKKNYNKIIFVSIFLILEIVIIGLIEKNKRDKDIQMAFSDLEENNIVVEENNQKLQKEIDSSISDWNLILVNKDKLIPDDYQVKAEIVEGNHKTDYRIVENVKNMLSDARKAGLNPIICSSYRSTAKQKTLFNNKLNEYKKKGYSVEAATEKASLWVAVPGTSEHEIGLALDIVSKKYQLLDEKQEETAEQQWLMEHCNEYGFVLRYPTDKKEITQINYEPWHYRYVGVDNAKFMTEKGYCLEEYIEYLKSFEK